MSGGAPRNDKQARGSGGSEHRIQHTAKKQVQRTEMALHRMRAKAAALLAPDEPKQGSYVHRILRHRDTGVRVRVLDTQAPDAPPALFDLPDRYVTQCETHGTATSSFPTVAAALSAARRSAGWCPGCAELEAVRPRVRKRARTHRHAGHGRHGRHPRTDRF